MARRVLWLGVLVVLTATAVVAQDTSRGTPISGATIDRKVRCESALLSKVYLRGCSITCRAEGADRIVCEGRVPSRIHACAVFLTCMGVEGVKQVDISRLTFPDARPRPPGATTVLAGQPVAEGEPDWKELRILAVVVPGNARRATLELSGTKKGERGDSIVVQEPSESGPSPFDAPFPDLLPPAHEGLGNDPYPDDTYREASKGDR